MANDKDISLNKSERYVKKTSRDENVAHINSLERWLMLF